jgi:hypothetical protein
VTLARFQANLGSPFVPLPLLIATGSRAVNNLQAIVNLVGQLWTQALGRFLAGVDISPMGTRVQAV